PGSCNVVEPDCSVSCLDEAPPVRRRRAPEHEPDKPELLPLASRCSPSLPTTLERSSCTGNCSRPTGAESTVTRPTNAQTARAHVDRLPPGCWGAICGDLERARVVSRLAPPPPRAHRADPARPRLPGRR